MKKILFLILIPLLFTRCTDSDPQQLKEKLIGGNKQERVIPVGILSIDSIGGIVRNTYPGSLEEGQSVDMAFKYGGVIERILVKEGGSVKITNTPKKCYSVESIKVNGKKVSSAKVYTVKNVTQNLNIVVHTGDIPITYKGGGNGAARAKKD